MKTKKLIVTFLVFIATIMLYAFINETYAVTAGIGKVNVTPERKATMPIDGSQKSEYTVKHQLFHGDSSNQINVWKLVSKDEAQVSTNKLKDLYFITDKVINS